MISAFVPPLTDYQQESVHRKNQALFIILFRAPSRSEVDRIYQEILKLDAEILDEPQIFPQHGPNYYAFSLKIQMESNMKL